MQERQVVVCTLMVIVVQACCSTSQPCLPTFLLLLIGEEGLAARRLHGMAYSQEACLEAQSSPHAKTGLTQPVLCVDQLASVGQQSMYALGTDSAMHSLGAP